MLGPVIMLAVFGLVAPSQSSKDDDDESRIVGGVEIDISKAPYQVSGMFLHSATEFKHDCGGTIVDNSVIVTAAHCFMRSENPKDYQYRSGSSSRIEGGTLHPVKKIILHPEHNKPSKRNNDIAVVWLSKPIEFGEKAKKIELFDDGEEIKDGELTIVTGWGRIKYNGSESTILRMVEVPKVNDNDCKKAYENTTNVLTSVMICAGYTTGGKDACQGDSGGPMVNNNKLAGVVSFGQGCGEPNCPGVYAKVSALRKWLDKTIAALKIEDMVEKAIQEVFNLKDGTDEDFYKG